MNRYIFTRLNSVNRPCLYQNEFVHVVLVYFSHFGLLKSNMHQTWMYTCVLGGIDFASVWDCSDGMVIPVFHLNFLLSTCLYSWKLSGRVVEVKQMCKPHL